MPRLADTAVSVAPRAVSRVLGRGGSSSLMMRRISSNAASRNRSPSNGVVPVSSSYSSTPSEYTSLRVSASSWFTSACSGLMYSGVPIIWANRV